MSHSSATFVFDGVTLYGEYNGTSDVMLPNMYETMDEVEANWRKQQWRTCKCGAIPVECLAHTYYGGGFWWHGTACMACRIFIGPLMPFDEDVTTFDSSEPPIYGEQIE